MRQFRHHLLFGFLALFVPLLGCDDVVTPSKSSQRRIVSLSPAISEILIDIGQGDAIVGCTPFAPEVLSAVPVVGSLHDVDLERILVLQPTMVLLQPPVSGMDEGLRHLAEQQHWQVGAWRLNRLDDVLAVLGSIEAMMKNDDVTVAVALWRARYEQALRPSGAVENAGSVLMLFGVDPPRAIGRATYLDDLLQALGGRNAIERTGYPELSLEDCLRLQPDTVLVIGEDAGSRASDSKVEHLRSVLGAAPRIEILSGAGLLRPSTRVLDGAVAIQTVLSTSTP